MVLAISACSSAKLRSLSSQRKHVGKQARLQVGVGVDLVFAGVGFGLGEDLGEAAEQLLEHRYAGGVHRKGHGGFVVRREAPMVRHATWP
ncbi:MAG: hypothetical protein JF591_19235 [Lysobacter sp.]|nr:hypothetical protein [Lysobacter sp.]